MGENLRVRTAPGQRSATVQRRVDDGLFGTGIGAKWVDLPVEAGWASDDLGRRYIAIDRRGLKQAIGRDAADAALAGNSSAVAKPPTKDEPDERDEPGPGHNSESFDEKLTPDPHNKDPRPPLDPALSVLPAKDGADKPRIAEGDDIKVPLAHETGDSYNSYSAFRWKHKSAGPGYEWHHIVSQHAENVKRFGVERIHNTNNIVRLPKWLHDKISHFHSTKQWFSGDLTVRKWLERQSFEEQAAYGRNLIERFRKDSK
jgi:hypothetical protein